jgi:transposase
MPVLDVAELEGLDKTTVYTIDKNWLERRHELQPKRAVKRIGIDEIAISSGHSYATVIYDLDRREVIGITCGRRYKDLCKILKEWPAQMREGVVAVCTDLWSPFHKAVRKHLPNAELVFDKFHVYKYLNDAVDQVRRCEMNKVSGELKTLIKGSRWIWLKKKTNLTDGQIIRLKEIVALNQNLFEAYLLKENFEEFYSCSSAKTGIEFLEQWFLRCKESGLKPMIQLAKRIKRWMDGILNYFKYKITNAVAEGINNKIKVLKRRSYGFHDMHYFFLKILDITGALPPLSSVTHNISE